MNAKQKYLLLLLLFGFVTGHAMEKTEHNCFSEEESLSDSESENAINNTIPTIDIDPHEIENNQIENNKEILLPDFDRKKTDETSNISSDIDKKDNPPVQSIRKYNPDGWGTFFMDKYWRGHLENVLHELSKGGFNEKNMSKNMARVNDAFTEAIYHQKSQELVLLIRKLDAINFPILKTKSDEAKEFLKKAQTKTQDDFVTGVMTKTVQYDELIVEKEKELIKSVMPMLAAFLVQIKKQIEDIANDTNKTVATLNTYKSGLDILNQKSHIVDNCTTQILHETTKTQNLIQMTIKKHEQMYHKVEQLQNLLTNTIEKK